MVAWLRVAVRPEARHAIPAPMQSRQEQALRPSDDFAGSARVQPGRKKQDVWADDKAADEANTDTRLSQKTVASQTGSLGAMLRSKAVSCVIWGPQFSTRCRTVAASAMRHG